VFMDEQKKGGALYLIKERGNATTKGEIQELSERRSCRMENVCLLNARLFVAALDQHAKSADRRG
jgi:hypothetical protein